MIDRMVDHGEDQNASDVMTIRFETNTGRKLRARAAEVGTDAADYVVTLVEREIGIGDPPESEQSPLDRAVAHMRSRTPQELAAARSEAMERYRPLRTPPAGKTLADVVSGQWPGDESDQDIQAALKDLS